MNKADLISNIQSQMQLIDDRDVSKADVESLLKSLETTIHDGLCNGREVVLPGIGKLSKGQRAERKGRNPQTGEEITIPAANTVKFKPLKALKDAIN
ncbi:MAG: HU family DNA-binding protein [Neptuniibacter sp.]